MLLLDWMSLRVVCVCLGCLGAFDRVLGGNLSFSFTFRGSLWVMGRKTAG